MRSLDRDKHSCSCANEKIMFNNIDTAYKFFTVALNDALL